MTMTQGELLEAVRNLVDLPGELTTTRILQELRDRYSQKQIFTLAGPVLISVNPFQELPDTFSRKEQLRISKGNSVLEPHIYSVAHHCVKALRASREPQLCVFSGESGAGKTEAGKHFLEYLSMYLSDSSDDGNKSVPDSQQALHELVIQCNPVMEAFGNSATIHNHNSSRFLKWLKVYIVPQQGNIAKITLQRFLLERRRAAGPARHMTNDSTAQNFHVFHDLCQRLTQDHEFAALIEMEQYNTLCPNGFHIIGGKEGEKLGNSDRLQQTMKSMETIGIENEIQQEVLRTISGLLWLGQIMFHAPKHSTDSSEISNAAVAELACKLLGYSLESLEAFLCHTSISIADEVIFKANNPEVASTKRDTLLMGIYQKLFDWLVEKTNMAFGNQEPKYQQSQSVPIHLIDVFGFEDLFQDERPMFRNSLEQLLINHCNETLFHYFHDSVMGYQLKLYRDEGLYESVDGLQIPSTVILDSAALELIGGRISEQVKQNGILAQIEDEIRIPRASDASLLRKLNASFKGSHSKFPAPNVAIAHEAFIVSHYAGNVVYNIDGMLEKSRNKFDDAMTEFCEASFNLFFNDELFPEQGYWSDESDHESIEHDTAESPQTRKQPTTSLSSTSIGMQFNMELSNLLATIRACKPWFVACMKPNDLKIPENFEDVKVESQLQYTGITDICHVRKQLFPNQLKHDEFVRRFSDLDTESLSPQVSTQDESYNKHSATVLMANIERNLNSNSNESYQFQWKLGKSLVFLTEADMTQLESRNTERNQQEKSIVIQKHWRRFRAHKCYTDMRQAWIVLKRDLRIITLTQTEDTNPSDYITSMDQQHITDVLTSMVSIQQNLDRYRQLAVNFPGITQVVTSAEESMDLNSRVFRDAMSEWVRGEKPVALVILDLFIKYICLIGFQPVSTPRSLEQLRDAICEAETRLTELVSLPNPSVGQLLSRIHESKLVPLDECSSMAFSVCWRKVQQYVPILITLQRWWRGCVMRKQLRFHHASATRIQCKFRKYVAVKKLANSRIRYAAIVQLQCMVRVLQARERVKIARREFKAACTIQSEIRRFLCHARYRALCRNVQAERAGDAARVIQCFARGRLCRIKFLQSLQASQHASVESNVYYSDTEDEVECVVVSALGESVEDNDTTGEDIDDNHGSNSSTQNLVKYAITSSTNLDVEQSTDDPQQRSKHTSDTQAEIRVIAHSDSDDSTCTQQESMEISSNMKNSGGEQVFQDNRINRDDDHQIGTDKTSSGTQEHQEPASELRIDETRLNIDSNLDLNGKAFVVDEELVAQVEIVQETVAQQVVHETMAEPVVHPLNRVDSDCPSRTSPATKPFSDNVICPNEHLGGSDVNSVNELSREFNSEEVMAAVIADDESNTSMSNDEPEILSPTIPRVKPNRLSEPVPRSSKVLEPPTLVSPNPVDVSNVLDSSLLERPKRSSWFRSAFGWKGGAGSNSSKKQKQIEKQLRKSLASRDIVGLKRAINCAKQERVDSELLPSAVQTVQEIERNHALQLLREAMLSRSASELRDVVEFAKKYHCDSYPEFQSASLILAQETGDGSV